MFLLEGTKSVSDLCITTPQPKNQTSLSLLLKLRVLKTLQEKLKNTHLELFQGSNLTNSKDSISQAMILNGSTTSEPLTWPNKNTWKGSETQLSTPSEEGLMLIDHCLSCCQVVLTQVLSAPFLKEFLALPSKLSAAAWKVEQIFSTLKW